MSDQSSYKRDFTQNCTSPYQYKCHTQIMKHADTSMLKLARKILEEFLSVDDPSNWEDFTVPADELGSYLADPDAYTMSTAPPMKLDTSLDTAAKMRDAPWNQMVVKLLAIQALKGASTRNGYFGINEQTIDWHALFNERIYRLFLKIVKARAGNQDYDYERKKVESRRRRSREYKLERRLQIAAAMIRISEALANNEQCDCWTRILDSISQLGTMGMSDDEQILDTQGQHGIVVYSPTFRHSQFDELFNKVDSIRGLEKYLFTRVGRNRLPRIRGYEGVERSPPANLPSSFYQPSYLEAMKKGVVNVVAISKEKTTIPSLPTPLDYNPLV